MSALSMSNCSLLHRNVPNWDLIDQVSINLLENDVARFDTLQAVLPSLLAAEIGADNTVTRAGKLLRIAQLQIEYLLKSQHRLVEHVSELESELSAKKKELQNMKKIVLQDSSKPFYKCTPCGKVFVNEVFLSSHLQRRHKTEQRSDSQIKIKN
uniref:C2H2-type domain-containing protein n=1 Tax=Heterorhabditis bacteriophora TaxID=37862 RepID=A0A1I7XP72_HETBA